MENQGTRDSDRMDYQIDEEMKRTRGWDRIDYQALEPTISGMGFPINRSLLKE